MKAVPTLYVEPIPGFIRLRLDVPDHDLAEPLQEEFRQPVDGPTMEALRKSARVLLRSPERPGFAQEAQQRGAVIYRTLIPVGLRAPIKAVRGPLLVSTSLYGLPWELLHDDEEFWGLRYALGKRLVMRRPLATSGRPQVRSRPRGLIIGSDPRHDLCFVRDEIEAVCETLEEFADIACVTDHMATFGAVTAYLGQGFDFVHYCGHVVTGSDGSALLLADEIPLSADVVEANLTGRPVVFVNGCVSARGTETESDYNWEDGFSGVAYGFLFGGALAVVGTLCDVSDRHAARLAGEFYRRVLMPVPVGEALRGAREVCRADPVSANSPSWLAFVLYGNPAQWLLRPALADSAPAAAEARSQAHAPGRARVRYVWGALALLVFLLLAGALSYQARTKPSTVVESSGLPVVGVMEVLPRSAAVPDWMREITRDSLNTILSRIDGVRVYSRQKIDFLREKRQLSEIEAAEALGMTKMLSATLAVEGSRVTLELQVVDIASGLLDGSDVVQGPQERLIELQNEFAVRALRVLGVAPPPEEVTEILASRTNDTLDAYRMLAETLGGSDADLTPVKSHSSPGALWKDWGRVAWAGELDGEEAAIRSLLDRWVVALEEKSIETLVALQVEMSEQQRTGLMRYFANAKQLKVRVFDVDILIEGEEALATFTRDDRFTDARSGRPLRLEVRISGVLAREEGEWKIRGLKSPL